MEQILKIRKLLVGLDKADKNQNLFLARKWIDRMLALGSIEIPKYTIDIVAWKEKVGWNTMTEKQKQLFLIDKAQPAVIEIKNLIVSEYEKQAINADKEGKSISQEEGEMIYCLMKAREILIEYIFFLKYDE